MSTKKHYDNHLGRIYSWMTGDFEKMAAEQEAYFTAHKIRPFKTAAALDLGAGNGLQSIPLARLGFSVKAFDFNKQLLEELNKRKGSLDIFTIESDLIDIKAPEKEYADLVVCMGDTITHLDSMEELNKIIRFSYSCLVKGGKLVLSFRDLTVMLSDVQRFIPVKSDEERILTCFLEYFPDMVRVTDLLYEKEEGKWVQKVSSYNKLRLNDKIISAELMSEGFKIVKTEVINRMLHIIAEK